MLAMDEVGTLPVSSKPVDRIEVVCLTTSATDCNHLRDIFNHTRWSVFWCARRAEALALLKQHPGAVFVFDADAQGADELIADAAAMAPQHRSLALTTNQAAAGQLLEAGVMDVIFRPIQPREVLNLVTAAWQLMSHSLARATAG